MVRLSIYLAAAILALSVFGAHSAQLPAEEVPDMEVQEIPAEVVVVEHIEDFLSANPGVEAVEMAAEQRALTRVYTLGRRVSGDSLRATSRGSFSWASARDATATVRYSGAVVTYVYVSVQQTSSLGRAYATSGGIGQRAITFVIEARSTTQFIFTAQIYGKP